MSFSTGPEASRETEMHSPDTARQIEIAQMVRTPDLAALARQSSDELAATLGENGISANNGEQIAQMSGDLYPERRGRVTLPTPAEAEFARLRYQQAQPSQKSRVAPPDINANMPSALEGARTALRRARAMRDGN